MADGQIQLVADLQVDRYVDARRARADRRVEISARLAGLAGSQHQEAASREMVIAQTSQAEILRACEDLAYLASLPPEEYVARAQITGGDPVDQVVARLAVVDQWGRLAEQRMDLISLEMMLDGRSEA